VQGFAKQDLDLGVDRAQVCGRLPLERCVELGRQAEEEGFPGVSHALPYW
jgi:hypothetical protein